MASTNTMDTRAKASAFDRVAEEIVSNQRADKRTAALQRVARAGGPTGAEAKRLLAEQDAETARQAKAKHDAALPRSIAEAGGDARAYSRADIARQASVAPSGEPTIDISRKSMMAELAKQGLTPVDG